jgi:hypothetical protein
MNTSYTILPNVKIDLGANSTWWITALGLFCLWACVFTHAYYFSPVRVAMAQHGHYSLVLIVKKTGSFDVLCAVQLARYMDDLSSYLDLLNGRSYDPVRSVST